MHRRLVVSFILKFVTLTEAIIVQFPKVFCGADGSGVGSLKLADAMPV